MALPSLTDQAQRLIELGVHDLAGTATESLLATAEDGPADGLLVTSARPSDLAMLMRHGDQHGFVVEDMTDVDQFRPTEAAQVPAAPYVVRGLDRGEDHLNRTPAETLPDILAAGRAPLTIEEGFTGCCRTRTSSSATPAS